MHCLFQFYSFCDGQFHSTIFVIMFYAVSSRYPQLQFTCVEVGNGKSMGAYVTRVAPNALLANIA